MAYFTAYFQKKALNFALSQLGIFDQDAFNLDGQDISWGSTTTIELRDVPLSLTRLAELLQLPNHIHLTESRVSLLRLTLPLNFVSNSVAVEIHGVKVKLVVSQNQQVDPQAQENWSDSTRSNRQLISKTTRSSGDVSNPLPTADDLAESFLESQSPRERAQLREAISSPQRVNVQSGSDSTENLGLGPDVSFKAFFANLARGVLDRFQAHVEDILIETTFKFAPAIGQKIEDSQIPEEVTFCLGIDSIDIPPVSLEKHEQEQQLPAADETSRARHISINGIHAFLLSTSALSSFMTQLSRPASPSLSRATSKLSDNTHSPELPIRRSKFKNSFRSGSADVTSSSSQSEKSFQSFEPPKTSHTKRSAQAQENSRQVSLSQSFIDGVEERLPETFGEDSQAWSDSDLPELPQATRTFSRIGSDLEHSALSESSETFLSRSPTQPAKLDRHGSQSLLRNYSDFDVADPSPPAERATDPTNPPEEDLTESRFFSTAEAKSIYMSAMSLENERSNIPGRWNNSDSDQQSAGSPKDVFHDATSGELGSSGTPEDQPKPDQLATRQHPMLRNVDTAALHSSSDDDSPPASLLISQFVDGSEGNSPPATSMPESSNTHTTTDSLPAELLIEDENINTRRNVQAASAVSVKTLLMVDQIQIKLPPASAAVVVTDPSTQISVPSTDLPGAFSMHNSMSASIAASTRLEDTSQIQPVKEPPQLENTIAISISHIVVYFDIALIRLLIAVTGNLPSTSSAQEIKDVGTKAKSSTSPFRLDLNVGRSIFRFEEALKSQSRQSSEARSQHIKEAFSNSSNDLLRFGIEGLQIALHQLEHEVITEILVAKLYVGFPDENVISFDRNIKMRESVRDNLVPSGHDLSIRLVQSRSPGTQLDINTAPIHINANVNKLADLINWLGGLSTVLDLGSSVKSSTTVTRTPAMPTRDRSRGVRFDLVENAADNNSDSQPAIKINLRIGGIAVDIIGKSATITIEGSALKTVFREGAIRAQIDRVNIYGPLLHDDRTNPALVLSVDTLAIAYLDLPKEVDLTRLLALLSPSQEREEQDDDILVDTLLRQRRKGGVLRINITKITSQISRLHDFRHFGILAEELSQLSSVTKYLPEDDRPGLLVLIGLDSLSFDVDVNQNIRSLGCSVKNVQLAVVTFPSLFLMSVGDINANHAGVDLVVQATPDIPRRAARQNSMVEEPPRLSLKFIAGEMEPTVRLRLYNVRIEYHVSTVMRLLGISETASGEVIVAEMVNTVANLATAETALGQSLLFQSPSVPTKQQQPFRVDIIIRDSAIGLNPKEKPAQGLLVLTKCRITAIHAEEQTPGGRGSLEIAKACFMVTDDRTTLLKAADITDPNVISGLGTKPSQVQCLEAVGYLSVGQVSAAKITAILTEAASGPLLDVEVRNDLLVLETSADSTQTLLSVLGGLAPPMPPRKGNKYRTEVIPIQDMLASFSGHAFPTDADSEDDTDYAASDDETGTIVLDEKEDLALDFDLGYPSEETAEESSNNQTSLSYGLGSVIFPEPGQMMSAKATDLASFHEEAQITTSLYFDENHFGKSKQSAAQEWNSYKNTYDAVNPVKIKESPLRIHLKDIHFIWNLYDGYDWQKTRDAISQAVDDIEAKAEEKRTARRDKLRAVEDDEAETVIGDMLFNSIYIGISPKDDPRDLGRRINGILNDDSSETGSYATSTTISATPSRQGSPRTRKKRLRLGRSKQHKMTFELRGISGDIVSFPPGSGETQSSIAIKIRDLEVFDNVPTSTWKKFATYMHDAGNRQLGSNMVNIEMLVVKPDQDLLASEFVLKIDVLPLRLHVDQDALDFLTRFFEFRDENDVKGPASNDVPFIQRAEVGPVQIKLDFKPKRVDWKALRSGRTSEFMNFIILDEADMILRKIILYGVRGFDKLGRSLNDIWTPDVRTNQLPGVLAGLAPVRPLVNVGLGVRDLIVVPMREYKKDGRLVRAVRKGVLSFGKTTTTELAKLGTRLAIGTHTMLSGAEGLLSPSYQNTRNTSRPGEPDSMTNEEQPVLSPYADQPIGVIQGLRGAYRGLERDLLLAKDAIVAMPGEIMESQDAAGAAAAVLRTAPVVILRPAMGITKAVGQTLMGATNTLDKTEKRRIEDKYKHR